MREELMRVLCDLDGMHAAKGWHWEARTDPFEIIVGAILVQNTAWLNADRALANLRRAGLLDTAAMASASDDELARLIRPSGQYRQKARKLRAFLALVAGAGGLTSLLAQPARRLREQLLGTWGIGYETADAILLYAAHQPSFVIDAYTIRLFQRLGLGPRGSSYTVWQGYFENALSAGSETAKADLWARYHALVVVHCKHLCRKRSPSCDECRLSRRCRGPGPAR